MGFNNLMKLDIQKFASGTISGGNYNSIYSYYMTWSSTSNGPEANTSNVTLRWIYKKNASDPYGAYNAGDSTKVTLTINGSSKTQVAHFDLRNAAVGATQTIATYTLNNVPHNADGSKSINVSGSHTTGTSWGTKSIGSTSITLDKIARYTNTSTWAVSSKTETSFTLNWKTDDVCSSIRYGTSTSSYTTKSVNANSGSVTISGLSANTSYTLYFMPCRKDSGLWGNGSSGTWKSLSSQKTHPYPTVTAAPSFVIGNTNVSITLNNPLSRTTSVAIKDANGNTIRTLSTSSATAKYDSSLDSATWYSKILNNPSGTYTATATWSGHTTTAKSGTFSVNTTTDVPDFNLFEWEDVNPITCELTKGTGATTSDIVILDSTNNKGFSNIQATISTANKAEAKNSAEMQKYTFECGSATPVNIPYSNSASVSGTINNAPSSTYKVSAIDSRGLSKAVTLSAVNVVNYTSLIKGDSSISRVGNVSDQTTLTIEGKMWVGNFGVANNQIANVTYKYKTASDATYTTGTTAITPTVDQDGNFTFTGLIKGDTADGFDAANVYSIQVIVSDELSSVTYTFTLPSGTPHLAWYEKGLSIMGEYDESRTDALQVNGEEYVKGRINSTGAISTNGFLRTDDGVGIFRSTAPYINFHYGNNSSSTSRIVESESGTLNHQARLKMNASQYWTSADSKCVDMANSDIGNLNAAWFADECTGIEGINFLKQNATSGSTTSSDYETLKGYRGNLYYNGKIMAPRSTTGTRHIKIPTSDTGGIQICWGTATITTAVSSAWGGIYGSGAINPSISFPSSFSSTPYVVVNKTSQSNNPSAFIGDVKWNTTGITQIQFWRGASASSSKFDIAYIAIGSYTN